MRAQALVVVVLLLSYGAVGARQPAVRVAARLPVPAARLAEKLGIVSVDRGHFVVDIVRTLFTLGLTEGDMRLRTQLRDLLQEKQVVNGAAGEAVPLPLDTSIWRETIFQRQVPDADIIATILSDRSTALLYHGLAGLDDDTLAWLGPERDTLRQLARHAGAFAVFGPSLRVQAGRIVVPGGASAEPMWQALIGADPGKPAAFVRRLFEDESGQLAWFYDTLAQLDDARVKFATSASLPMPARVERMRALLDVFTRSGSEWRPADQPFSRRPLDPGLTLALVAVDADGRLVGPARRELWERVFSDDGLGLAAAQDPATASNTPIDAAWLIGRIHRVPLDVGRRRLEAFLFAQRVFADLHGADAGVDAILRAHMTLPALIATLERVGVTTVSTMNAAIVRAQALNDIGHEQRRRVAIMEFQSTLAIVERIGRTGGLPATALDGLVNGLVQVPTTGRGYDGKLASWIRKDFLPRLPSAPHETPDPLEDNLLAAMAGAGRSETPMRTVTWEGRAYRLDVPQAEITRLHRLRQRQGGPSLSEALDALEKAGDKGNEASERALADTLTSILYAAYLGDPEGPALAGGNIAVRHDLGGTGFPGERTAWHLPSESHTVKGWRITGSLLGLDVALARMSLRRLDASVMPPEPRLVSAERQTAALSVVLLNPLSMTDATRDEIAAALTRGRAQLEALGADRADLQRVAHEAGLSAWRREALAWTATHDRGHLASQLSLVELLWLGQPRAPMTRSLDGWGAATLPLDGCLCLAMPHPQPWEFLIGRPSLGLLATRGADVAILVADTLASLKMPAEIAPGVIAFAMQEVMDQAQPAHFGDWPEFTRAVTALTKDRLVDYIAAQAAGGALLPARAADDRQP